MVAGALFTVLDVVDANDNDDDGNDDDDDGGGGKPCLWLRYRCFRNSIVDANVRFGGAGGGLDAGITDFTRSIFFSIVSSQLSNKLNAIARLRSSSSLSEKSVGCDELIEFYCYNMNFMLVCLLNI